MQKYILFIWIVVISTALVFCVNPFAPKLEKSLRLDQLITDQKTPEDVLINFKYAYIFKDSTLYSNLIDSSYTFEYFDPDYGSSGLDRSMGRDEDLRTTGRMFRNFTVIDLTWNSTVYSYEIENLSQLHKGFRLNLVNDKESFNITGIAIFTFVKNLQDGVWRIRRWKDESNL